MDVIYLRTVCFILYIVGDSSTIFFYFWLNSDLIPAMLSKDGSGSSFGKNLKLDRGKEKEA